MQDRLQTVYLFQCGEEGLFAVTHDASGSNIPRSSCTQGWRLNDTFQLKDLTVAPGAVGQEAMRRGISTKGYYIWRADTPAARATPGNRPPISTSRS